MHHDNAAEHNGTDEVVTEFDQTNGKAEGLVGDSEFNEELDADAVDDGSGDGGDVPLTTSLVEDLADGGSDQERRD
jgi:hypothetical protein